MPWRVVELGAERWNVSMAAEQRGNSRLWRLVLAFRAAGASRERAAVWANYPIESASKGALFSRAETIPDDELVAVLRQQLESAPQAT